MKIVTFIFLFGVSAGVSADIESQVLCNEILIDEVTDMAFGDRGKPFTGKIKCYYDGERTKLHYTREFVDGYSVGEHYCYKRNGRLHYTIVYKDGKRVKRGYYSKRTESMKYGRCYYEEIDGYSRACYNAYGKCF